MIAFARLPIARRTAYIAVRYIGIGALIILVVVIALRALEIRQRAAARVVPIHASYRRISNLAELTGQSDLVVVGTVVGAAPAHFVSQPEPQSYPVQPATKHIPIERSAPAQAAQGTAAELQALAEKQQLAQNNQVQKLPKDAATDQGKQTVNTDPGLPMTTVVVQITRVLHGDLAAGAHINVSQPGGTVELPTYPGGPKLVRTLQFEEDPLMAANEQHVLFLKRATDGTYYVVGGPQGRLALRGNQLAPIVADAPATHDFAGKPLDQLAEQISSLK